MASGRDLQGLSRILKLSLDAAMTGRAKPQTTNGSTQDSGSDKSSSESREVVQGGGRIVKRSKQHLNESSVFSCRDEEICQGHVCKHGSRGRGRSLQQQCTKCTLLQQGPKASNSSAADQSVWTEGRESVMDARETKRLDVYEEQYQDKVTSSKTDRESVMDAKETKRLDVYEEQGQGKVNSSKTDRERLPVKQLDNICELPDLVKCQVYPQEKAVSAMSQPGANELPVSDHTERGTTASSSLDIAAGANSLSPENCLRGYQRKHAHVSSQLAHLWRRKPTLPFRETPRATAVRWTLQEQGSRHTDKQLTARTKTAVDVRMTNISQYSKTAPGSQNKACVKESRYLKGELPGEGRYLKGELSTDGRYLKGEISSEGRYLKGELSSEGRYLKGELSSEGRYLKGELSSEGRYLKGELSCEGRYLKGELSCEGRYLKGELSSEGQLCTDAVKKVNKISKHAANTQSATHDTIKDSHQYMQQITEVSCRNSCKNGTPKQANDVLMNLNESTTDLLGQAAHSGADSCFNPSLNKMIHAIYQSYEGQMEPHDGRHSKSLEASVVSGNGMHEGCTPALICGEHADSGTPTLICGEHADSGTPTLICGEHADSRDLLCSCQVDIEDKGVPLCPGRSQVLTNHPTILFSYEGQSEMVSVHSAGQYKELVSVPAYAQSVVMSRPAEAQSDLVSLSPEGQSEGMYVAEDDLCEVSASIEGQCQIAFPPNGQPMRATLNGRGYCDEISGGKTQSSQSGIEASDSRKAQDTLQSYCPRCLPCFQTRELSLPAETVSSRLTLERIVQFVKSCSTDVQEYMDGSKEGQDGQPVDVIITVGLSPSLPSSHCSSHAADRLRHCYNVCPAMCAPPYWHWRPLPECCSPSIGTPISNIHSLSAFYPGMMQHPLGEDNRNRRRSAPGYLNQWACSTRSVSCGDYSQNGSHRAYTCGKEEASSQLDCSDHSHRQPMSGTVQTVTRVKERHATEPVRAAKTNKCQPNNRMSKSSNTFCDRSTMGAPVRAWQKDVIARHLNGTFVSSPPGVDNSHSASDPPPASHHCRYQLGSQAVCPSTSFTNSQTERPTTAPDMGPNRKSDFIPKVAKKSWIKQTKYQTGPWRQGCTAADSFTSVPGQSNKEAWRRHSLSLKETHWAGLTSSSGDAVNEEESQPSQVRQRMSGSFEGKDTLKRRTFWHCSNMGEVGAPSTGMTASTSLEVERPAHSKRRVQAIERASLLVTRSRAYKYMFVDTHCHIDFLYSRLDVNRDTAFYKFRADYAQSFPHNYEGCVAVFCNPNTFNAYNPKDEILKSISTEDGVWLAVGCHPKNSTEFEDSHLAGLRQILQHPKVVALGEIGLDYSSGFCMARFDQHSERQKLVFRQQLYLALEMKLPIVVHCRDADDDCLEILVQIVPQHHKIHAHCFTRDVTVAQRWLKAFPNLFLGLTPVITYKTATAAADTATHMPLDRLLLETDAPYFLPGNLKNGSLEFSHPGLALCTAEKVAELRNIPVDEVLRACRENTRNMYGI